VSVSVKVADRVADAWYGQGRPGDDAAALGVVAALTLLVWPHTALEHKTEADAAEKLILDSTDGEIADLLAHTWRCFYWARPDLCRLVGPFASWHDADEPDPGMVRAAAAVARAAVKAGIWGGRCDDDVIGTVWTSGMRSDKARQARGEYYTPPAVTELMARMTLDDVEPGQSICDPCAGTGGMFLGAATALRSAGKDPADNVWYGADISAVSVAGLAVNCHVWGLGRNVFLAVADTLADPEWPGRAEEDNRIAWSMAKDRARLAAVLAVTSGPVPSQPEPEPRTPRPVPPGEQGELFAEAS
jgi:hypothetical protein